MNLKQERSERSDEYTEKSPKIEETNQLPWWMVVMLLLVFIMIAFATFFIYIDPIDPQPEPTVYPETSEYEGEINESEVEDEMHRILNNEREERELNSLVIDSDLTEMAGYKSSNMVQKSYISHESPSGGNIEDRFKRFAPDCVRYSENLAQTYYKRNVDVNYGDIRNYESEEELARGIMDQFIASEGHKDNLLDESWDSVGVSMDVNENGKVYVAHEFCEHS